MQNEAPPDRPRGRIRRFIVRWFGVVVAALVLLGLSQALWWWETWPVRQLLDQQESRGGPG